MSLALRLLWRDWRSGELRILFGALVLAVSVVTGVGLFAERLQAGIDARSATFLAGDLLVRGRQPVPEAWFERAAGVGLRSAEIQRFPTMSTAGERLQLVNVSAVSASYPLLGRVTIRRSADAAAEELASGPPRGELWVDPRLLLQLDVAIGDEIGIGNSRLRVAALLLNEPDAVSGLFAIGPRVMMHLEDLPATGIVQPGSRVQYNAVFAGQRSALEDLRGWLAERLQPGQRLLDLEDGQPGLGRSVGRVRQFLLMAACLGVILAGVAVAMAARRFAARHVDYVAILKTLGMGSGAVARLYLGNFLLLGLLAVFVGWAVGALVQAGLLTMLGSLFDFSAPSAGWSALGLGAVTGLLCLLSFAMPPLLPLFRALPLRVLRRDLPPDPLGLTVYAAGLAAVALLLVLYTGDLYLTGILLGGVLLCAAAVGTLAFALLRLSHWRGMQASGSWRLALAGLRRHLNLNAIQMLGFSITLMLLLVLGLVRDRLIDDWSERLEEGRPNHFLLNIAPWEREAIDSFLAERGLASAGLYPMVPGRIVEHDGQAVVPDPAGRVNLNRDFNLSWSATRPADNELIAGEWWQQEEGDGLSIEQSLAEMLGIEVGDRLVLSIAGERVPGTVRNVRALDWDSMNPNFYVIMQPSLLREQPATWLTSFFLPPERKDLLVDFSRRFPTVTVIELDAVLAQARTISRQASRAVEMVLALGLVAGLLVLLASVQAGLDERFLESAVLRSLGARRRLLLRGLLIEFLMLGALAGVLAALGAELASFALATWVLEMDYRPAPLIWLLAPLVGAVLGAVMGVSACRRAVDSPPISVLRTVQT